MKVRLVAYRKATSSATADSTFQLDLQEEPNIPLNYQFSDIREPESRKGSYSQTFKLPFTDNNNNFFQYWYNVNLETLVFNTRVKFDAVLYVGSVPQFEGMLQLKSIYQKAQYYEVVLLSNSATLFTVIGNQRLKDVFKNDDGSYTDYYNYVYTYTEWYDNTLYRSWGSGIQNTAGDYLYDSDIGIAQIVYPFSVTEQNFYYDGGQETFLNMDQDACDDIVNDENGGPQAAWNKAVNFSQFKPAIQLRTLLRLIIARAGFTYTSDFIDGTGDYSDKFFGKLFMTLANYTGLSVAPTVSSTAAESGHFRVAADSEWGNFSYQVIGSGGGDCVDIVDVVVPANSTSIGDCSQFTDEDNIWNTTNHYFTKADTTMSQLRVNHRVNFKNVRSCWNTNDNVIRLDYKLVYWDLDNDEPTSEVVPGSETTNYVQLSDCTTCGCTTYGASYDAVNQNVYLNTENMANDTAAQVLVSVWGPVYMNNTSVTCTTEFILGEVVSPDCGDYAGFVEMNWAAFGNNIYGSTIDIPACVDPDITQSGFLKDIIQRFNLVVLTDPNDASNLLIQPYNDFINSGELKDWTDKIDLSKEIVVKDTTSLQKKTIHLTDLEDKDLYNKSIKENYPGANVYGHIRIDNFENELATGELKNQAIFSPLINGQVFVNEDEQAGTYLPNLAVHYDFTYERNGTLVENKSTETKPKIFYYSGTRTNIVNTNGDQIYIYFHRAVANGVTALRFKNYALCTPFSLTAVTTSTLTQNTQSVYWNATPPIVGGLAVFNYDLAFGSWFNNTLYGKYWKPYLDNIYSDEARIMECNVNLNEVDIFNFSFADEYFIKDSYWRVLNISNYQVGAKASTKVTLIKSLDTRLNCNNCNDVIGELNNGSNVAGNGMWVWCPEDDPTCTPSISGTALGMYTSPECCTCNGGIVMTQTEQDSNPGEFMCYATAGSLPLTIQSIFGNTALISPGQLKSIISGKLGGTNRPIVTGVDNNKYSTKILNYYGDDIVIKYRPENSKIPQYRGESHRMVLAGQTNGNTLGYAYPSGDQFAKPLYVPSNSNIVVRVKGSSTVVGGTSSTYTIGTTDAIAYFTAFVIKGATKTQLGGAGGEVEFQLREGANPVTCTLNIDIDSEGILKFGLQDSQTDTIRIWTLTAEIEVNEISNMVLGYNEDFAIYQNAKYIDFQNSDRLIWN
tara:strand:+ start:2341 stop:5880 length:3540 start_codon:yes stop_codon:yes gene_type:complete